jgi:hypothetical protein
VGGAGTGAGALRRVATLTALGLIAEIGGFARFANARELMSWLGMTPSEYSSGQQQQRGHITRAGNAHAWRLLVERWFADLTAGNLRVDQHRRPKSSEQLRILPANHWIQGTSLGAGLATPPFIEAEVAAVRPAVALLPPATALSGATVKCCGSSA